MHLSHLLRILLSHTRSMKNTEVIHACQRKSEIIDILLDSQREDVRMLLFPSLDKCYKYLFQERIKHSK